MRNESRRLMDTKSAVARREIESAVGRTARIFTLVNEQFKADGSGDMSSKSRLGEVSSMRKALCLYVLDLGIAKGAWSELSNSFDRTIQAVYHLRTAAVEQRKSLQPQTDYIYSVLHPNTKTDAIEGMYVALSNLNNMMSRDKRLVVGRLSETMKILDRWVLTGSEKEFNSELLEWLNNKE